MEVLNGRLLLAPSDMAASLRFYGEVLGLAVAREFGSPEHPGVVFFMGGGFLELSGHSAAPAQSPQLGMRLWMQVRDVAAEYARLRETDAVITRAPQQEPWGLIEMWLQDPDGVAIALVEVPADHPIRRDTRD